MKARLLCTTLAVLSGLTVSCGGDAPEQRSVDPITETLFELDLMEPLDAQSSAFLGEKRTGLSEAVTKLRELLEQPLAKGLFVRVGPHAGRMADVDEWAAVFDAYRAQQKPVHCHFDSVDNAGYALLSHCDRVSMTPAGSLELVGIAAQVVFGRAFLELLGVEADLLQMGKYKGAAEPFTRKDLSPEMRQSLNTLLLDLDTRFREHLATRLKQTPEQIAALLDQGPYTSEGAKTAGLIDAIAFDDEARSKAKSAAGARVVKRLFDAKTQADLSLRELLNALSGPQKRRIGRPHLALVHLEGEIIDTEREPLDRVGGSSFVRAMRKFGDDNNVRAVVLRIDSPGGSALASDRMWHAVRRVAKRKPVIVSIGGMAASGGYYVASAGTHVIAAPSSVVGSIGVVGGKMVIRGLADKVGVNVESIERSRRATWLSPFEPFSDDERKVFENLLRDTYDRFLSRVAEGRKKNVTDLLPAAEGRIMGGERGKSLGLVDEVGTLATAFERARKEGKLPKDAPIAVWPERDNPLQALSALAGGVRAPKVLEEAAFAEKALPHSLTQGALVSVLLRQREPIALALPFALDIR